MVFTLLCCIEISLAFYIYSPWTDKAQDLANRGEIVRGHPLKKLKPPLIKKRFLIQHIQNLFYTLDIRPFPKSKAKAGYNQFPKRYKHTLAYLDLIGQIGRNGVGKYCIHGKFNCNIYEGFIQHRYLYHMEVTMKEAYNVKKKS